MMFSPLTIRKLPSISVPPMEPNHRLCVTQQAVEHHITQRTVSPLQRNSAQVLATVPMIGSSSMACCSLPEAENQRQEDKDCHHPQATGA